jgi:hypothetical protein
VCFKKNGWKIADLAKLKKKRNQNVSLYPTDLNDIKGAIINPLRPRGIVLRNTRCSTFNYLKFHLISVSCDFVFILLQTKI